MRQLRHVSSFALLGAALAVWGACNEEPGLAPQTLCPGGIVGDTSLPPQIDIVGLQPGDTAVQGTATNIDARSERVVLWARTDIYYVQPLASRPRTLVCSDGSWSNTTNPWERMVALLVDSTYVPGPTRLLHPSADPGVLAWDEFPFPRPDRTIAFAGRSWTVKYFETYRWDPGPNFFSDSVSDVWVDNEGGLHLRTANRDAVWYSTEVFLREPLGFGEYTFQVLSRVDSIDYQAVFAGFIYDAGTDEFDIEFSQALADPDNAQYAIQPADRPGNILRFPMPPAEQSSHRFVWRADRIEFASWRGLGEDPHPDSLINSWAYAGPDIPPPDAARMYFNLWLVNGVPPLSGSSDEVVIASFRHRP